ncbi:MAG: hypothetical protein EOO64_01555 [Massilia sp.]|nr:MAG: hypothetical protein EOO64_01555 [Massilia sp.]
MIEPRQRSLSFLKWQASADVDQVAGEARLRYITDVPGQQAVYITKLEQARAYVANPAVSQPYIAAEALARGVTAGEVAQLVLDMAELWNDEIGPAIEAARIKAKLAIEAAADAAAVDVARAAGVQVLQAL